MLSPLSSFINQEYTSVYAYAGVAAIKSRLVEQEAMVVLNEDDTFLGVLTPTDVLMQPHHLVIDCLRHKPMLYSDQTVIQALRMMLTHREAVLPVIYHDDRLAGLLYQSTLVRHLIEEHDQLAKQSTSSLR